jgi:TonB family protein
VLLAAGGWFAFGRGGAKVAAAKPPAPVPAAPAPAPGLDAAKQAEIQAQIQQMIEARSKDMESKLKTQYDDQIKQLQKRLEESRKTGGDAQRAERAGSASQGSAGSAVQAAETKSSAPRSEPPAPQTAATASLPLAPASPPGQPVQSPAGKDEKSTSPSGAGGSAAAAPPLPDATAGGAPSPAVARTPQVQVGDLVSFGPGVVQPKFISMPEPHYPAMARRMNRTASVTLKVLVDERGRVAEAERTGSPAGYGFDEAALSSARNASYHSATKDGVRVKMWIPLKVEFKP